MEQDSNDQPLCVVLINEEEQFSLWPKDKAVPSGWRLAGKEGPKHECLEYIDEVWTDMRPLSLRRHMASSQ